MMPTTPSGTRTRSIVEAVRPRPPGDDAADGIGQGGDLLEPLGHGLDALGVERQAVEEGCRGARLLAAARSRSLAAMMAAACALISRAAASQRGILRLRRGERQLAGRLAARPAQRVP